MAPNKSSKRFAKKELDFFKGLLLGLKDNLLHDIKNMSENPKTEDNDSHDISGHVQHMADVATDMYDREFNMGLASHDREILKKIDAALKRIEEGTYGICLGTGKPISLERLKALPYAEYCREYQEQLEKQK